MVDNVIGDVLERLAEFKHFQSCLKSCTDPWLFHLTSFESAPSSVVPSRAELAFYVVTVTVVWLIPSSMI